jgi:ATP-dependent helicase/nuclease subunit A
VLDREVQLAQTEELNLLYVAMTRARQALIVSGAQSRGKGANEGWQGVILNALATAGGAIQATLGEDLSALEPGLPMPAGGEIPVRPPLPPLELPGPVGGLRGSSAATEFGELVHAVLERLAPPALPAKPEALCRSLGAPPRFEEAWDRARQILQAPELERFFNPSIYVQARNELSYVQADGSLKRIDRVVEFADEIWVLDYKTGDEENAEALLGRYRSQIEEYRQALSRLMPGKPVRSGLITANGGLLEA